MPGEYIQCIYIRDHALQTRISKWGNSLGVRIPKIMADDLKLQNGSEVELLEESDEIIIRPHRKRKLDDLLSAISEGNLHGEVNSGDPTGKENW